MAAPIESLVRTKRTRRRNLVATEEKRSEIAERVARFYSEDIDAREEHLSRMLQIKAKLRGWTEGTDWPWEEASDQSIPDLMIDSLRMQDTLVNAVLSGRPAVKARATTKENREREEAVDNLLDYQMFVEQSGEREIQKMALDFVEDGCFTAFVPWVREQRKVIDVRTFEGIPDATMPVAYFRQILAQEFKSLDFRQSDEEGWDFIVGKGDEEKRVHFYTAGDDVEMEIRETALVYEGPRVLVKDWEDVIHPARCENLQPPGPSNPNGAAHVILRDRPTLDEIKRLAKQGHYDLVELAKLEELGKTDRDSSHEERREQIDAFQGEKETTPPHDPGHKRFTRIVCFDCFDVDGDGLGEEVVWFVLLEPRLLLKAATLGELYPGRPPRRPFAEDCFLPVPGSRWGMGLPETQEGIHDLVKQLVDQMIDANTLKMMPFGFYRAASNVKPELLRLGPGDMAPLNDPRNDVSFPQINVGSLNESLNIIQLAGVWNERVSTIGDLQLGRVPFGKSSALRTAAGMASVLAQGEARPERILRRFFSGLTQVYGEMHRRNRYFMPEKKMIRVAGAERSGEEAFVELAKADVDGIYEFEFTANVLNSSKQALQQSLQQVASLVVSPLAMQFGITDPGKIHRLFYDMIAAWGVTPETYVKVPDESLMGPQILVSEAILSVMGEKIPQGRPAEGAQRHLQGLVEFQQSDQFGLLTPNGVEAFRGWLETVSALAQQEAQAMAQMQALMAMNEQLQAGAENEGGMPGPAAAPENMGRPNEGTKLSPNELMDETMAGNGRGVA